MNSSAEQVAKIAADLKAGRVHNQFQFDRSSLQRHIMQTAVTVDSTQVYKDLVKRDTGVFVYEDHAVQRHPRAEGRHPAHGWYRSE